METLRFLPGLLSPPLVGSLTDAAYTRLKRDIIELRRGPGDSLKERDIAAELGYSKTPVREALARLQSDGLVRPVARVGYVVTSITLVDAAEICDMRVLLQSEAAALAAERGVVQGLADQLKVLCVDTTKALLGGPDLEERLASNYKFEAIIANSSGNSRLAQSVVQLFDELERIVRMALKLDPTLPPGRLEERQKIVDAILSRRPEDARAAMRERTLSAKAETLGALGTSPSVATAAISLP